jgi:hypothetical protein
MSSHQIFEASDEPFNTLEVPSHQTEEASYRYTYEGAMRHDEAIRARAFADDEFAAKIADKERENKQIERAEASAKAARAHADRLKADLMLTPGGAEYVRSREPMHKIMRMKFDFIKNFPEHENAKRYKTELAEALKDS